MDRASDTATTEAWALNMVERWTVDGVGKWLARDRLNGSLVGRGGFTRLDVESKDVLEVGWAVRDHLTGRGYATEIGIAALDWAAIFFPDLPVVSFTEVHDLASQAVMRHLGMREAEVTLREGLIEGRLGLHRRGAVRPLAEIKRHERVLARITSVPTPDLMSCPESHGL